MPDIPANGPIETAIVEQFNAVIADLDAASRRVERWLRALESADNDNRPSARPAEPVRRATAPQHAASSQGRAAPTSGGDDQNVRLRIERASVEQLMDFQEQLSQLPGVTGVTISATGQQGAALIVHLRGGESGGQDGDNSEENPTVVCVMCGRVISQGGAATSHGLCPECTDNYLRDQLDR